MKKLDIIIKASEKGLSIPDDYKPTFHSIIDYCKEHRNGYLRLVISTPYKHRSTGEKSQNHHINGHVTQISNFTGEDFDIIKMEAKRRAIKRGYPTYIDIFGNTIPVSESEIDSTQAGYLIEELHMIADFLSLILKEI